MKKEICHPGSLNTLQHNVLTGRVCDTFGMWKPPKLYGGGVKHRPHLIRDVDVLDGSNNISAVATGRLVAPNDIKMVAPLPPPMLKTF